MAIYIMDNRIYLTIVVSRRTEIIISFVRFFGLPMKEKKYFIYVFTHTAIREITKWQNYLSIILTRQDKPHYTSTRARAIRTAIRRLSD